MFPRLLAGSLLLAGSAAAQESRIETLLSNEFGLEVGGVVDGIGEFVETDRVGQDGFDLDVRTLELDLGARLTPWARFYGVGVYEDEDLDLAEGAVVIEGVTQHGSLAVGRTFLDFGKQMPLHRHELRTVERPLVLRSYLGDWAWGDGVRYDDWFATGEQAAVRFSLGLFGRIGAEGERSDDVTFASFERNMREPDSPALTARITGYADLGPSSQFQVGASFRSVPDFAFEFPPAGGVVESLNNALVGVDATFAWTDLTGVRQWTFGTELLWLTGDIGATLDDNGTPGLLLDDTFTVIEDDAVGFYTFLDYGWSAQDSCGVQYSWAELPRTGGPEVGELDLYYTRFFGLLSPEDRLRVGLTLAHSDSEPEALRFVVQFTTGLGAHPETRGW